MHASNIDDASNIEAYSTCDTHARSRRGVQFWARNQLCLGYGSARRSAEGVGAHRAIACDLQRQKGSLLHVHSTACSVGDLPDRLSPALVAHSSPNLGQLLGETGYKGLYSNVYISLIQTICSLAPPKPPLAAITYHLIFHSSL